ncbi:MAG: benzoate/H(+) symporter BenE family transporter, partial [Gammaproteobacteria bacterium]|nr:benzoate/H(+) symporter BenE family transporter [Gammaproteobacteria bacterium]
TVMLASAFDHLSFEEIVGAFLVTGVLMTAIGFSGWVRRAMELTPMPIVMGMVAGVFLTFGIGLIQAFDGAVWIALPMVVAFLIPSSFPTLARALPPVVAAMLVGALAVMATHTLLPGGEAPRLIQSPNLYMPALSWKAMAELVIPLAVTVLVVQNGQGFAILQAAKHKPPMNAMTVACGVGSVLFGLVGSVSTCVTGPANAVLASSGERNRQYTAGITYGVLGILFGVFSATTTWLALKLPPAYIATLGGLAILRVLQGSFVTAFRSRFTLGALITFLVTVSDVTIWNIGAPFWGLMFGFLVSWLLEREDFRELYRSLDAANEVETPESA